MTAREATLGDIDFLVMLTKEFHSLSPIRQYKFSPESSRRYFQELIISPLAHVAVTDSGAVGGVIQKFPYCDLTYAQELFWYSHMGGKSLLNSLTQWAVNNDCDMLKMSSIVLPDNRDEVVQRYLSREGFVKFETAMVREFE